MENMEKIKTGAHKRAIKRRRALLYLALTVCMSAIFIGIALIFMSHFGTSILTSGTPSSPDDEVLAGTEEQTEQNGTEGSEQGSQEAEQESKDKSEPSLEETDAESEGQAETEEETEEETETETETEAQTEDNTPKVDPIEMYHAAPGAQLHSSVGHNAPYTVIIDPGHGFADSGCVNLLGDTSEKDITLATANQLKTYLENYGFTVFFTHDGENCPSTKEMLATADDLGIPYDPTRCEENQIYSPYERTVMANIIKKTSGNADLFISLHVNAVENAPHISGMQFDYCKDTYWSDVSKAIFDNITSYLKSSLPQKELTLFSNPWDDSYIVNKYVDMPSVLLEMGYSTNEEDAADLLNESYRDTLVKAIANGIYQYFCGI